MNDDVDLDRGVILLDRGIRLTLTDAGWLASDESYRPLANLLDAICPGPGQILPSGGSTAVVEAARMLGADYQLPSWPGNWDPGLRY